MLGFIFTSLLQVVGIIGLLFSLFVPFFEWLKHDELDNITK